MTKKKMPITMRAAWLTVLGGGFFVLLAVILTPIVGNWFKETNDKAKNDFSNLYPQPNLWSGLNQPISGSSSAWFSQKVVPDGFYSIDFWLDNQKYGRVTLDFVYPTPVNISEYQYIQFTVVFNEPNNPCYFYLESETNGVATGKEPILLRNTEKPVWYDMTSGHTTNAYIDASFLPTSNDIGSEQYQFKIALSNYKDYKIAVKKIGFFIDTNISKGSHSLMIGDIKFLK